MVLAVSKAFTTRLYLYLNSSSPTRSVRREQIRSFNLQTPPEMSANGIPSNFSGFDTKERARLLGAIDQFRELGIGEDVSLPQLVVVGDQSSGKSSLLEGLTGLAFPVASDLCTRSATQIVLRRTAPYQKPSVRVSIIPGPDAKGDEKARAKLESFAHEFKDEKDFKFDEVIAEAAECMGLPSPDADNLENLSKRFSDDVLKIELTGPQHPHLSVVDVPGLFHNPTKYQTKEDAVIIRQLIERYLKDKRTIILAVMDGRNNLANQEVFRMARAADPLGSRTVGIITKLDALQEGEKNGVFKIAANEVEKLHHGWFVVKNRSPQEIADGVTIEQRHVLEANYFKTSPWDQLSLSRRGVPPLRDYLCKLLYEHIRAEFPGLVKDIKKSYTTCSKELDGLGQKRDTTLDQRKYLINLATQYQAMLKEILIGIYPEDAQRDHALKLRMHLHRENERFCQVMRTNGHTKPFKTAKDEVDSEYILEQTDDDTPADEPSDIYEWIRQLYRDGRGLELSGVVNMFLIAPSFRAQTIKWHSFASDHLAEVYKIVRDANTELFASSVSDQFVRERLEQKLTPALDQCYEVAKARLGVLIEDERSGIPQTVNHYFAETLSKIRSDREAERQAKSFKDCGKVNLSGHNVYYASEVDQMKSRLTKSRRISNEDQAVYDIHDILKSYYKVAFKRFVDNVVVQVVERIFITEGPLKVFTPEFVASLTDADLNALAEEEFSIGMRRKELETKVERLEKAIDIARTSI